MLRRLVVLVVPVALVLGACSSDDDDTDERTTTTEERSTTSTTAAGTGSTSTTAGRGGATTSTTLGPTRALSGSGGAGTFRWNVVGARSEFCYSISLDSRSAATQARLYRGPAGQTGDVVLELQPPGKDGTVNTCSAGDQILVEEIRTQPSQFYIQVTTSSGTTRGQLA